MANAAPVGKCEKTRDFLIDLRKNLSISALFRSFSHVFHRCNREVAFCGGAARSVPVLERTEGRRRKNHCIFKE